MVFVSLSPEPHSGFRNLVFYIFYFDVATFRSNLKLISDKCLPWGDPDVISIFFRLESGHRTAVSDYKTDPCISVSVLPEFSY